MNNYLLFCDRYLYDHDIIVGDFVRSFATADEAIDFYNENLSNCYGGLIAKYDGLNLSLEFRTVGHSSIEHPYRDGWIDGWKEADRGWIGAYHPES